MRSEVAILGLGPRKRRFSPTRHEVREGGIFFAILARFVRYHGIRTWALPTTRERCELTTEQGGNERSLIGIRPNRCDRSFDRSH